MLESALGRGKRDRGGGAEQGTSAPAAPAGWASWAGCWRLAEHHAGYTLATWQNVWCGRRVSVLGP